MQRRLSPSVRSFIGFIIGLAVLACLSLPVKSDDTPDSKDLDRLTVRRGICVLVGSVPPSLATRLAQETELTIYRQSDDADNAATRQAAVRQGTYGTRVCIVEGSEANLHLADNLADVAIVEPGLWSRDKSLQDEVMRVVHPGGQVLVGETSLTVPIPEGLDDWSHPYHGPDNNPQSTDLVARAPYLTQFLCEPWYVPMPQVTVAAGGRVFKAFGHIALKEREWRWANRLVALNGFNGTLLWERPLKPGFMIHRNTLIATPDAVYVADDSSCKVLSSVDGELLREIAIPDAVDADGVWKWMALRDGVLYALVGEQEPLDRQIRGVREVAGWPWNGLGSGYAGEYAWGFGRTLLAMDLQTENVHWTYRFEEPIDSRALCMTDDRIFVYSHQKFLASVSAATGKEQWRTWDSQVMDAIGEHDRAQTASKGFSTSAYARANDVGIYFAGPQRRRIVAVSALDGSFMWDYPDGNFQLVLREDALYAMGRMQTSKKFDFRTGEILADLECYRGNCTRATGTVDSIFTRGYRHTGTMRLDLTDRQVRRIPLMRPACQDGVIAAAGMLYWGPWMCDCNHSLVGMIGVAPAGDFDFTQSATTAERLRRGLDSQRPEPLRTDDRDWPNYRKSTVRSGATPVELAESMNWCWQFDAQTGVQPTAPIAAGDMVFWSGRDGIVYAARASTGELVWKAFTEGPVLFPPEVWEGRIYVGSCDGYVYCFEAQTGRRLWRFDAAPTRRTIAVHGSFMSNWPVGGGVLVADGVVYAAAGLTSYDGTHVYALDAVSGEIRWQNNTSSRLASEDRVTGVSVQGHLLLYGNRLYLAGGNVVSPAIYDIADGSCLNTTLSNEWWKRPEDAAEQFPGRPENSMFHRSPRGRELFLVDGVVRPFDELLYAPVEYGPSKYFGGRFLQVASGDATIRATTDRIDCLSGEKDAQGKPLGRWHVDTFSDTTSMALGKNAVLVVGELADRGHPQASAKTGGESQRQYAASLFRLDDGQQLWTESLPAAPVSWGVAVTRTGTVVITLHDGRVIAASGG